MARFDANQSNTKTYTLVDLLDERQPYQALRRFKDSTPPRNDCPIFQRIQGSLLGLAIGDALGAPVEFRPNVYLREHPVEDMQSGGTWSLQEGQWTDDTSMALCLAASLIVTRTFNAYDQLERYRRWFKEGYMSSTGNCFDIGKSTRQAIIDFETLQQKSRSQLKAEKNDPRSDVFEAMVEKRVSDQRNGFHFGKEDSAGNGALMRIAPIPCFCQNYEDVDRYAVEVTKLTHGAQTAIDASRFYAGLIWHALTGKSKNQLLDKNFYRDTLGLTLHEDILQIAQGSYKKKNGYDDGIRGKGHVVSSLEAALWAFYNDRDDFKTGVLLAINLGDDTDTTAAIYGQLAGAVYGINGSGSIPQHWIKKLYQGEFIKIVAKGLYTVGWKFDEKSDSSNLSGETNLQGNRENPDDIQNYSQHDQGSFNNKKHDSKGDGPGSNDKNYDSRSGQARSNDERHDFQPGQANSTDKTRSHQNPNRNYNTCSHQDANAPGEPKSPQPQNKPDKSQTKQQGNTNNQSESDQPNLINES